MIRPSVLAAVAVGGFCGGLARYAATIAWPTPAHAFPWATFAVNTTGAFALAALLVVLLETRTFPAYLRPALGTGFLGAFTTFSAVTVAVDQLAVQGHLGTATGYLGGSVLAGLAAATAGLLVGRLVTARGHTGARRHREARRST